MKKWPRPPAAVPPAAVPPRGHFFILFLQFCIYLKKLYIKLAKIKNLVEFKVEFPRIIVKGKIYKNISNK